MEKVKDDGRLMLATLPACDLLRAVRACAHACADPKASNALGCVLIEGEPHVIRVSGTDTALFASVELRSGAVLCQAFSVALSASALISQLSPALARNPKANAELYVHEDSARQNASHAIDGRTPDPERQYGTCVCVECGDVVICVQDDWCAYPADRAQRLGELAKGRGGQAKVGLAVSVLERAVKSAKAVGSEYLCLAVDTPSQPIRVVGLARDADTVLWEGIAAPAATHR